MSILVLTSDTLIGTPAAGNIEYNGQFFGTDSNASRAQLQRIVRTTEVSNPTSPVSSSIDFASIPAWCKRITVMFNGVSSNGTSLFQIQLGDAGGIENTSYVSLRASIDGTNTTAIGTATSGFVLRSSIVAAQAYTGQAFISNLTGNSWVCSSFVSGDNGVLTTQNGSKTLSDVLTQVRITTVSGADTFDAGSVNIIYEG
jgi:hypothetical protein